MREYSVYILECSDSTYYIGITNDLDRRMSEHDQGFNPGCYTFFRRPVRLVYNENFESPLDAIYREKQLKRWSHKKKKALIQEHWSRLHELGKGKKGYRCRKKKVF